MLGYSDIKIIPMPKKVEGYNPQLPKVAVEAKIWTEEKMFLPLIDAFVGYAETLFNIRIKVEKGGITVVKKEFERAGYTLQCAAQNVRVLASTDSLGYALSTLLQMAEGKEGKLFFDNVEIKDCEDCRYRGFMVDVARKFHKIDTLKNYVDLCFFYKINHLHIHFIDNQSYTLPSKYLPKLCTPERSYTFEEISDLVDYAHRRKIELIPEFEIPGHSEALISSYPDFFGNNFEVEKSQIEGIYDNADTARGGDNIMCIGKKDIFEHLTKLLSEISAMFPYSKYIHIGGDEATISDWDRCTDCKAYMQKNLIQNVKALYTHFVKIATDIVLALNRTPIVWEGFSKEGAQEISDKVIVIAWESYYHLAPDLIEEGFCIINCSWKPLYIVPHEMPWDEQTILDWNIYNWQHFWEKSEAHLNPIHVQPTDQVLGAQLCAWECSYEEEIQRVMRRLPALSERTWSKRRYCEYEQFAEKLEYLNAVASKLLR